ncbi:P-loop containing nucleoside triphosphate hydrolase protein [Glomus cerebriforme]|uniref:P-loop containing nucleoside triphosphate hydrolase protein n=1 Tax=Glomus cerebriforme TaxID=658196 RepID=A0A397S6E1_9GLOM|nr:P-loop containing nucleoside triphosphate hydrolase protein [Glomus cerebriforme]
MQKKNLEMFDFDQNYLGFTQRIPKTQVQIANNELSFSNQIPDLNHILKQVFGFSSFCEGQYEAICSFLENKDTLVVLRTRGGKTLYFTMAALASSRLTVVFTPLKALIDDYNSLICMGISAAELYASTGQSFEYQERIVSELSLGILPILFVTPEKLEKNKSFHQLLQKIYETRGIQFVIDETHCVLDYSNFRDSWIRLENLKRDFPISPIMLLTATCNLTTGRCIIYCSGPGSCQELFNNLREKLLTLSVGLYHSELDGKQCKIAIKDWKIEDISNEICRTCDNCLSSLADKLVWKDFSTDIVMLLKIAKEILASGKISEMVALDIVAIYCKLKRADELGLSELPVYNEPFEHKLKNKANTLFIMDELCIRGFLIINF